MALGALSLGLIAAAPPLPPYGEALACAAVTQAASKLAPDDREALDHAIYWSLATMDAARAEGISSAQAEADQKARREAYVGKLRDRDPRINALLGICAMRVPAA
ncbi:hypothetical protein [Caulobacter ginsengisoli]|uniref:hypothetical protein n=1 Tax=Caulobacter ginsengisoli TaxID=400775 RepID=UPI0027D773D1|nr:hypothetical protein [Caulobacter ginsengisoli]